MYFSLERRAIFPHPNFKKWSEPVSFLTFWLANVLLATAACNSSTSQLQKNGPRMLCFVHFDFEMCFSLQQRAIFPHPNFKKWSEPVSFFNILRLKCASRYSGVQFLISPLNSYLRTRRFTEPTFRPSRPTNHWKNAVFRDFTNISHVCILFLLTFAQLYLLSSDSTSLLCFSSSDSTARLCFFNSPYCRKFHF